MPASSRRAIQRAEVVVLVVIAGALLLMLFPWIGQQRELSRRDACANNLAQIAQAANKFEQRNGAYPVGTPACGPFVQGAISEGCVGPNWLANLLEDLGLATEHQTALDCLAGATRFELDCYLAKSPVGPLGLGQISPPQFNCPSATPITLAGRYTANGFDQGIGKGSYAGCFGVDRRFENPRDQGVFAHVVFDDPTTTGLALRALDLGSPVSSIKDGASATLLASEVSRASQPDDVRGAWITTIYGGSSFATDELPNTGAQPGLAGSNHPGGVNCIMVDGSLSFIANTVDRTIWMSYGDKAAGDALEYP